jgi:cytochrome c-type biogenesis protein CcmE
MAVKQQGKFVVAGSVIVLTLGWLGWVGVTESKTYYHTVAELRTLEGSAARQRMRVGGDIRSGSIERREGRVDFVIEQDGHALNISYVGRDPLPDTFVEGAQALVEGKLKADGTFEASHVQAKCASKYEAAPGDKGPEYAPPKGSNPSNQRPAAAPGKS